MKTLAITSMNNNRNTRNDNDTKKATNMLLRKTKMVVNEYALDGFSTQTKTGTKTLQKPKLWIKNNENSSSLTEKDGIKVLI